MWTTRSAVCVLALVAILTAGCSQPVEVTSVYGPGVRFSETAHSYAWGPESSRISGDDRPPNPNMDRLIRESIETHLARKGLEKVSASGAPDFWVDYAVGQSLRADAHDFTQPKYKEGHLVISVLDPATSKLIWKGGAATRLDESTPPDVRKQRLDLVVRKVLDQVPSAKRKP